MTQYIGQITVILETETSELASETLNVLAKQLDDTRPEVVFADHNGDVEDYEQIEQECEESLTAPPMITVDQILNAIARENLGISTLETQKSDRLDFHDVSVWCVKNALKSAFDAGAREASPSSTPDPDLPTRFDDYEIQPCRRYLDADEPDKSFVEPCEAFEADFWTVYGHIRGEGAQAIGDFDTRDHAEEVFARITGHSYTGQPGKTRKRDR